MPRTLDKRIEAIDVDDGRKIVMRRAGYCVMGQGNGNDACHTFGADTNKEIRLILKEEVGPCSCGECQKALAGSGQLWS